MPFDAKSSLPTAAKYCLLSFPHPSILLVLINRPKHLNSLNAEANFELDSVFRWFDQEPALRVAIISGVGKAFCVGSDIKEWISNAKKGIPLEVPENGFGGLSFRHGKKPIIAAVNGPAYGGGCDMALSCDLVVATESATFAIPEVKRGFAAVGGGLAQLLKAAGKQRAAELALTGRAATAEEFRSYGICNYVVDDGSSVVEKALDLAKAIAGNSPDAVIATVEGLRLGWEPLEDADATRVFAESWARRLLDGENVKEGLESFLEKRQPRWKDSKL